jgi:Tol biopolymer transport system component
MVAEFDWSNDSMPKVSNIMDITADFRYDVNSPVWSADSEKIYFSSIAEGLKGIFVAEQMAEGWAVNRITDADRWNDFGSPFHVTDKDGVLTLYTTWCSMDFPTELVAVRHTEAGNEYIPVTDENGHILSLLSCVMPASLRKRCTFHR